MTPLLLGLLLVPAARAAAPAQVKRGDLRISVKVTGTVVPDDIFRITAPIEGRVERVLTSTGVWRGADQSLAFLAHQELAAILDSKGAQNVDILEDRWQRVYRPTPVNCPNACFILKNFMTVKSWVKPQAVLIEAARALRMVARVRPEDVPWVRDGQNLVFWAVAERDAKDLKTRRRGRVARFMLDIQGERVSPGGSFTLFMSPDRYFPPGTEWEGEVVTMLKKDALLVPTDALIRHGDAVYLPIRVSTGITTQSLTQITAGVEEKRDILILDTVQLGGAERHNEETALPNVIPDRQPADVRSAPADSDPDPAPPRKPGKHAEVLDSTDYGEDPYGEP